MNAQSPLLGARVEEGRTLFGAFTDAPACSVRLYDEHDHAIAEQPLTALGGGYFTGEVPGIGHGALYRFALGELALPDPYARFLPRGVHGPAMVVATTHAWRSPRIARPRHEHVIYELHVGTFTPAGTYAAAAEKLGQLADLGVTTLELMPLSAFAGRRGWGYDGVAHFAPYAEYGTPDDLRRFVDRAHEHGLSLLLDVVYNHFGPDGNYLGAYSKRYFTRTGATAWGDAPDYSEPAMRRYLLENARYWLEEFRFDGLRLDATHAIVDPSSEHILGELARSLATLSPKPLLIAEDERNAPELVTKHGLDAIWADDFHHQAHVTLTNERDGYYAAYAPGVEDLARVLENGWLYTGETFPPTGKPRGASARALDAPHFVYCLQNHDQVGNRALGERLSTLTSVEAYRAMALLFLCLPMTPLLFMGDEWAASTPFFYFTDHTAELGQAVTAGRRREFEHFAAFSDENARNQIPDPQAASTFARSKLDWAENDAPVHSQTRALFRAALTLRREDPVLRPPARARMRAEVRGPMLGVQRRAGNAARLIVLNLGVRPAWLGELAAYRELTGVRCVLASAELEQHDNLPPRTAAIFGGVLAPEPQRGEHD